MDNQIFQTLGINNDFDHVADILLVAVFLILVCYGVIGLVQLIKNKSIKKVDIELTGMIIPLVLVAVVYFVFDKVIVVHTRPISDEPSFPSTHVMVTTLVLLMVMTTFKRYISDVKNRIILSVSLIAVIIAMAYLRVASGMHWMSDVLGGLGFGIVFWIIYLLELKFLKGKKHEQCVCENCGW